MIVIPENQQREIIPIFDGNSNSQIGAVYIPPSTLPPGTLLQIFLPVLLKNDSNVVMLSYAIDITAKGTQGELITDFSNFGSVELCFESEYPNSKVRSKEDKKMRNQ